MEQLSSIRFSKLYYSGLPILFLVLYVVIIPSPSVSKIHLQDNLGYVAEGYDFTILNLSSPSQITRISSYTLPYWVENFTIENRLAYVITGDNSIHIIDIRDLSNPKKLGEWKSPGVARSIAISGGFAYVANHSDGVRILSVNDPSSPHEILHINNLGTVLDVVASQNLIYLARGPEGLDIYDTSSITKSGSRGHYEAGGSINQITILAENRALLMVDHNRVQIINISNLQNIVRLNSFIFDSEIRQAILSDNRIFIVHEKEGLLIARIKDDGNLETPTNFIPQYNIEGVASVGDIVFFAAGVDGVQAINISKLDNVQLVDSYSRFFDYKLLIGGFVVAALLFWLAFFAQFVLPVQTFGDRQRIFDRLLTYLLGLHGPAIFIRDGQPVKGKGEERKKGPGVLWLDSASGVVTRTDAAFKNTFGPGVHFTESGERTAGYVDLHTQIQSIGSKEGENPFAKKNERQSEDEYASIQKRRMETSALTRDGIEIVPSITVIFKIDADPVKDPNEQGSRFGFNAEAVRLTIMGEAINPNMPRDSHRYRIPWNQLPALLATDVWRDLLSKFTLNDLFQQKYPVPPAFSDPQEITTNNDPLYNPLKPQSKFENNLTNVVKELNRIISQLANWIDEHCNPKEENNPEKTIVESKKDFPKAKKMTGLQLINFLMRERLQKLETAILDQYGNYEQGQSQRSHEYSFLQSRGIRVVSASIGNLRLPPEVDEKLINQWSANWLGRARDERDRLNQEEGFNRIENEENTLRDYIVQLSNDLLLQVGNNRATDLGQTLRSLMLESRVVLVNETQLFRQHNPEREGLEEIIQWLETRDL